MKQLPWPQTEEMELSITHNYAFLTRTPRVCLPGSGTILVITRTRRHLSVLSLHSSVIPDAITSFEK